MKIGRFAVSAAAVAVVLLILKPALIKTEESTRLLVLFRWQGGEISFVNSVTQRPVTISFTVGKRFERFSVVTDDVTEAYYTHGMYEMNRAAEGDSIQALRLCSMNGISVRIGFYIIFVKEACMEVLLLWTI